MAKWFEMINITLEYAGFLTSLYCFSKRVLRMKSTAFFVYGGWVNIFLHSITPNGSFRCSSFHISCLKRLNFRHSIKTCRTVCEVWPHSHCSLSTIFRLYKNERSPIFPVLICTSKELCGFFSLVWIFKLFWSGCETWRVAVTIVPNSRDLRYTKKCRQVFNTIQKFLYQLRTFGWWILTSTVIIYSISKY